LKSEIVSEVHYPIPGHLQKAVSSLPRTKLPVTEKVVHEILSLPIYPKLTENQVVQICDTIKKFR